MLPSKGNYTVHSPCLGGPMTLTASSASPLPSHLATVHWLSAPLTSQPWADPSKLSMAIVWSPAKAVQKPGQCNSCTHCDGSESDKPMEIQIRLVVPGATEQRDVVWLPNGSGFLSGRWKCFRTRWRWQLHNIITVVNATELCTLKWWISHSANFH